MRKLLLTTLFSLFSIAALIAAPGDTTIIQTFDFSQPRSANKVDTFSFPDGSKQYAKVLMYYTIKCDPDGNYTPDDGIDYPCGEWDMIVYTDILTQTGVDTAGSSIMYPWRLWTYITPYGGGLERSIDVLNNEGWRYVFDVTDFLPLLKGDVIMRDGNYLERVDIKFAFIEGTPTREVKNIKPVWNSREGSWNNEWNGFPMSKFDSIVSDTTFQLQADEKTAKLRTTVTGHNFGKSNRNCGEFCSNKHKVKANGSVIAEWEILQSCDDNHMYPQSGTWVYARAGWCPGMEGKTQEFELTPYIRDSSINFDYDIESDPYGYYCMTSYLVTYGDILQENDVEAEQIIAPTTKPNFRRLNPSAFSPIVVIKNIGAKPLTSANISYGFVGGEPLSFEWKGNLPFMQTATIELPEIPDWNKVTGSSAQFYFELSQPNGEADPTPYNNRMESRAEKPQIVKSNNFTLSMKTNKKPRETYWQITDIAGNVVQEISPDTLKASTSYDKSFTLPNGTYCLTYYDKAGNGLGWWANNDGKGTSNLRYVDEKGNARNLLTLNVDFGSYYKFWFVVNEFSIDKTTVGGTAIARAEENKSMSISPNPVSGNTIKLDISGISGENLNALVYDYLGQLLVETAVGTDKNNTLDISYLTSGVYSVVLKDGKKQISSGKFIVNRK